MSKKNKNTEYTPNELVIVRGIPGSGKSTFSKSLGRAICSADDYFMRGGEYKWWGGGLRKAHEWCLRKTILFMKRGVSPIIIDNTTVTDRELRPYTDLARNFGYRTTSIIVENRHDGKSVHDIPEKGLEKMKSRFSVKL